MISHHKQERALILGLWLPGFAKWEALESFEEIQSLARTARVLLMDCKFLEVREISPATYLGKGRVDSIQQILREINASLVIVDGNLSPTQNRNLEETWEVRVVDRTSLILDIFALHAKSREGKLQVELAQYEYLFPRLVGAWSHFSRQRGGGVGLRGPGETQLEVDRRRIRDRLHYLRLALKRVSSSRELHRKKRETLPIPTVTLVGYTNAGKSTLFNSLTNADQFAEDQLFATLDPKTKRIRLPSGQEILLTDTVGFIRNLPHSLVEAFKSTFEEARQSDLLLHVVDASHENYKHQVEICDQVLKELSLNDIPLILVMNKVDLADVSKIAKGQKSVPVSAVQKKGLDLLLNEMEEHLSKNLKSVKLFFPHPYGQKLSFLYSHGRVFNSRSTSRGIMVEAALPKKWENKLKEYCLG